MVGRTDFKVKRGSMETNSSYIQGKTCYAKKMSSSSPVEVVYYK